MEEAQPESDFVISFCQIIYRYCGLFLKLFQFRNLRNLSLFLYLYNVAAGFLPDEMLSMKDVSFQVVSFRDLAFIRRCVATFYLNIKLNNT